MPVIAHPDVLFLAAVRENARRRTVIYRKDGQKGRGTGTEGTRELWAGIQQFSS